MKKHSVLYLFILVLSFTSDLFCVNRTMTIDEVTLSNISSACLTTDVDPLIKTYWDSYTRTTREEEPDYPGYGNREFTASFGLEYKAYLAYQLVIGGDAYNELSDIRNYLYSFPWQTYQRALHHPFIAANSVPVDPIGGEIVPNDWDWVIDSDPAWYSLEAYSRGRELSYNLLFSSFMIDMLYYAHDVSDINAAAQMDSILTKFNEHLQWVRESFFADSQAVWDTLGWQKDASTSYPMGLCYDDFPAEDYGSAYRMPMIGNDVNRFILMCGLGYGAIVTGEHYPENIDYSNSLSLIKFVKREFVSDTEYPAGSGCYGMNDYLLTKTGMYIGGISYQNRVLYLTPLFLTALNRVHGINLYNTRFILTCHK